MNGAIDGAIDGAMERPLRAMAAAALLAATWAALPAQAARPCEARAPSAQGVQQALELAQRSAQALDARGALVLVLARAGQDLWPWGLRWSHLGWAYREAAGAGGPGPWRVLHKLNECGFARGDLYRQGLAEFFLDDLYRYEAAYTVPTPALQAALLPLLRDSARAAALHQPATLRVGAQQRLGARMTSAHIAFDDHPQARRYSGRSATVKADSVFQWLQAAELAGPVQVLR